MFGDIEAMYSNSFNVFRTFTAVFDDSVFFELQMQDEMGVTGVVIVRTRMEK